MPFGGWVLAFPDLATVAPDDRNEFGVKRQRGEEAREPTDFLFWRLVFCAFVKSVDVDHYYLLTLALIQKPWWRRVYAVEREPRKRKKNSAVTILRPAQTKRALSPNQSPI